MQEILRINSNLKQVVWTSLATVYFQKPNSTVEISLGMGGGGEGENLP